MCFLNLVWCSVVQKYANSCNIQYKITNFAPDNTVIMKIHLTLLAIVMMASSCQKPAPEATPLADPSGLKAEPKDLTTVVLTWTDNAQGEKGYRLFLRGEGDSYYVDPVATVAADAVEYEFSGLEAGAVYDFGVQAVSEDFRLNSQVVYLLNYELPAPEIPEDPEDPEDPETPADPEDPKDDPAVPETDPKKIPEIKSVKTSYAYVAVSYKVQQIAGANPEHGICFSETGAPSVDDIKVLGPQISANAEILQVVPNAYLEDGKEYQMSAFIKDGDTYRYSEPQTVKLEAQPETVTLDWVKQDYAGAEGVDIYKTTSQLNGRNFNAWYAVADPSKVDFRVMYPETKGSKKTVQAQAEAAGDCLALINGAIYGNYNIGVIFTEGKMTQEWHGEIEGCYWASNSQLYQVTRPIIGVDKDGKAAAYWVGVPQQGTFYYYDRPQANVVGQAKYGKVSATSPVDAVEWNPYYAISCGPMVLYDGKVSADNTMVDDTHYYTNYECWDESGVYSAHPDRSAVGVTADGKIVLFICDGRIDASQGAYMKELGPIMKSLGCVHAMNLDGGGSTGMWVSGAGMINHMDGSWRAVKSTLGFFKK